MFSTWVEIDTDAIRNNTKLMRGYTDAEVMAIVKADGYGHGAVVAAQAALEGGAAWCGVARCNEAMELRQAGIDCPILHLGFTPEDHLEKMIENQVSLTAWSHRQLDFISKAAERAGEIAKVHLIVDTGMSRIGAQPEETLALARLAVNSPGIQYEGLYSHFAKADVRDPSSADIQWEKFQGVLTELDKEGLVPPLLHHANSAAGLTRPEASLSFVRSGVALYGMNPSPECTLPEGFRPALTWKSILSQVKTLPPGRGVSYGHLYVTQGNERIGTVPVGYADGYRLLEGNQVLVGGKRVPVVGRVTMDHVMVQLDEVPDAKAEDEVVLIGKQGDEVIRAGDIAKIWGTINYEVTCVIGPRVPRLYT